MDNEMWDSRKYQRELGKNSTLTLIKTNELETVVKLC